MTINYGQVTRNLWSGLSSDTKPTDNRVHYGDAFLETDTSTWYLWNGSAWSKSTNTPVMRSL